jgi:hypothetical protein
VTMLEAMVVSRKRSESRRFNTLVRLDDQLVEKGRKVAALKGISLAEFFSDTLWPIVNRELDREVKKLSNEGGER